MKTKILILFLIITGGIYSCRRDHVPDPVILDYRDSVTGNYSGTMHYVKAGAFGSLIMIDTTYSEIISVEKDPSKPNNISVGTYKATLKNDFSFEDDDGLYWPHGYFSGTFSLSADSLTSRYNYSWQGIIDTYDFKGKK